MAYTFRALLKRLSARRGQVALYVLIGVVLLVGVSITLYLLGQQRVAESVGSEGENALELSNGPDSAALLAEKSRVTERLNRCADVVSSEAISFLISVASMTPEDFQSQLERDISERFLICQDVLGVRGFAISNSLPKTEVVVSENGVSVHVEQSYVLVDDDRVRFSSFDAFIKGPFQRILSLGEAIESGEEQVFDENCSIDLYAFADENIFTDLYISDDGTEYLDLVAGNSGGDNMGDEEEGFHRLVKLPPCEVSK